ncbi:MAG: hypothetical protein HYY64_09010 [Candidatus Rokubacteria bacterium]|nr:hypothetical protein [Candidatus Rokubacteria bacterium]
MVLIIFHRILIGTAVVFGAGFAVWELLAYRRTGAVENLLIGVGAVIVAAALGYYLKNLKRFVRY